MLVLGTGWGSVTFIQGLSEDIAKYYDITVVPRKQPFSWRLASFSLVLG